MELTFSSIIPFASMLTLLIAMCNLTDCYDPLDPNGNITVTFDIHKYTYEGYVARVTIQNYYQYRHVDQSGWKLGWTWVQDEIILSMAGAFATEQGNCSNFKYQSPHCCKKIPVIADNMIDASAENQSDGCCKNGFLSAYAINPAKAFSSFEMSVGNLGMNATVHAPQNLTLLAPGPGYTCDVVKETDPTVSSDIGGRRQVQVFKTWKSTCTYSSFLANKVPICCVSLSSFYNPTITSCPKCSCGCREADQITESCIKDQDIVQCTDHMCPVRVHWHIKSNYMDHWRIKLTVSNYNYKRNYTNWNVLVQHPGFSQKAITYSFNNTVLPTVGLSDEVALFWGISNYNEELLQADDNKLGSLTTDILLEKDAESFTFRNGWAFPRRIYFNGEECEMPLPDTFPMLPNGNSTLKPTNSFLLLLLLLIFYLSTFSKH